MALLQVRLGAACHMSCFEEEALLWQRLRWTRGMIRPYPQGSAVSVEGENTLVCEQHGCYRKAASNESQRKYPDGQADMTLTFSSVKWKHH